MRKEKNEKALELRAVIADQCRSQDPKRIRYWVCKMATGHCTECPFRDFAERTRQEVIDYAVQCGFSRKEIWDPIKGIDVELLQWALLRLDDPDAEILEQYRIGVPLGDDIKLPRARAVFERKTSWRIKHDFITEGSKENANYSSAKEHYQVLEKEFAEQSDAGMMFQMSKQDALKEFGNDLYIAPLAVIEEKPDQFRVLHDGSHKIRRNQRIKIRDQVALPMIDDDKALMSLEKETFGNLSSLFALVFDVSKAHRRVWLRKSDWGKTACKIR